MSPTLKYMKLLLFFFCIVWSTFILFSDEPTTVYFLDDFLVVGLSEIGYKQTKVCIFERFSVMNLTSFGKSGNEFFLTCAHYVLFHSKLI